jgi:hypothetical protein
MLAGLSAVVENAGVVAAGFFQSVGEDGQVIVGAILVNALSQEADLGGETRRINRS